MPETHQIVTKVWIAPGCIVCDACENDCPEVFDVKEDTCLIRPPAQNAEFLKPLTPSIITAMEGCPVEVIKIETKEVEGPAPWANQPAAAGAAAGGEVAARAPAAKAPAPLGPPDPKFQALLTTSKISPSLSAGLASTIRRSPEVNQADEILRAVQLPKDAPPDQRVAMLAVGGAYQPAIPMAERLRQAASKSAKTTRRQFNFALAIAWGLLAFVGLTFGAMFQDFFGLKVLKEPKKLWRVGKPEDFAIPGVYENFKRTPDGSAGFWLVNLQDEKKVVAISTICTHLGCIPNWLAGENKFKCPCHGSGYYITGVNFEGPTPRPLERFAISKDPDGYLMVDMTRVYRSELGQWDDPESFVAMA
ncbi:MAG TPA: Rieske 2Fe-2S domain-containing protein [Tepidisphaeraceae bacterium]|jgi:cytochrome b6-f complex iron-sulfur subunit